MTRLGREQEEIVHGQIHHCREEMERERDIEEGGIEREREREREREEYKERGKE